MIPEEKIKEIVDKTDIVDLVGEYVSLKKRGKNYFGLCPFHDDENPSFSVSPEKKICKCMSCGEGGNPINFLRKIKNITFEQACKELALKNGVSLENVDFSEEDNSLKQYYEINQLATNFYENYLFNTKSGLVALDYLHKRGLNDETIKKFHIGLAPKEDNLLYQYLKKNEIADIALEEVGLIDNKKDLFKDRVMFPIIDDKNRVLAFSGRIYYPSETEPKYINTKETVIYKKGECLYNLNNAVKEIRKKKFFILCEGQMDVIAMANAGFNNTICSLGTALTPEQVLLLKKYANQALIMYDGDMAGIKATKKAFKLLYDFKAYSVTLPDGMDPDEYLKKYNKADLENYIRDHSLDIYEFNFNNAFIGRNLDNVYDFEEIKKEIFSFLKGVNQNSLIEKYLIKLASKLKVSNDSLFDEFKLFNKNKTNKELFVVAKDNKAIAKHEIDFLALCVLNKDYYEVFNHFFDDGLDYIRSNIVYEIYQTIIYYYNMEEENSDRLIRYLKQEFSDSNELNLVFERLLELNNLEEETIDNMIKDIKIRFEDKSYQKKQRSIRIFSGEVNDENLAKLNQKLALAKEREGKA